MGLAIPTSHEFLYGVDYDFGLFPRDEMSRARNHQAFRAFGKESREGYGSMRRMHGVLRSM